MDYPISEPGVALLDGKFTDGNPLVGLPASRDPASWANAVTDEIRAVITDGVEEPGQEPTEGVNNQMLGAIKRIVARLFGERIATQPEVDAGVRDDVSVTPKKMRLGFSASFGTNGYIVFPTWMRGLIIQWGVIPSSSFVNGVATAPLNIAFSEALFGILATHYGSASRYYSCVSNNLVNLTAYAWYDTSYSPVTNQPFWVAIGK